MGILGNILNFVRDRLTGASVVVQPVLSRLQLLAFGPDLKAKELIKFYRHWVYVASSKNASAVASVPLRLYVTTSAGEKQYKYLRKGVDTKSVDRETMKYLRSKKHLSIRMSKAVEVEEVVEHPFLHLWLNVNPHMNGFEMLETLQLFLELTGNAYLYVYRDALGTPKELWVLPSQYVTIVPSKENFVQGYLYGKSQHDAIAFAPEEIVHFKFPNPNDMFYGYSPLQAAVAAVIRKDDMDAFEDSLLKNYARPDFVLSTKNKVRKGELERLREEFDKLYSRRKGRGRPAVLDNDLKIETLGFSPREMAMLRGQKFTREEILGVYGVPISKVTTEDVNLANAEVGEVQYQRDTILPRLNRNEDKVNENLMPMFDPRLFVAFDNPVPENEEFKLNQRDTDLKNFSRSINEIREEQGLEPVAWGDVPLVPMTTVPLGSVQPQPQMAAPGKQKAVATMEAVPEIPPFTEQEIVVWDYSEPYCNDHAHNCCDGQSYESKRNQFSDIAPPETELRKMELIMRRYYRDIEKTILILLRSPKSAKDLPPEVMSLTIDVSKWARILAERMGAPIRRQLAKGGQIGANALLEQAGVDMVFDVLNPEIRGFLERYVAHFSRITTQRLADRFSNQLRIGLDAGESITELAKRFQKLFGNLKKFKAQQIARSESSRAVHSGMVEAWKQSGVVEALIWDAQTDACPWCLAMDGTVVALGQNFFNMDDSFTVVNEDGREQTLRFGYEAVNAPPLHPNCVCTVRAVVKEVE